MFTHHPSTLRYILFKNIYFLIQELYRTGKYSECKVSILGGNPVTCLILSTSDEFLKGFSDVSFLSKR